jgi:transposase
MQVVYERCCGLDVHKKLVVACLSIIMANGQRRKEIRTFGTMTQDLLQLLDWLKAAGCTHVAFESTGVYWRPIFNLLEGEMTVLLVNAQHIKAVPGRKTDIKDAEWIADLLQHGLLRASFIPPAPQRELRELTRYRASLVADRARLVNRLQKVLEDTNLKLASVASDITGVSARAILDALLAGQSDPKTLAELARGRLRGKREQLAQALVGTPKEHHRFLLSQQLELLDCFDEQIASFNREIAQRLAQDDDAAESGQTASAGQPAEQVGSDDAASTQEPADEVPPSPSSFESKGQSSHEVKGRGLAGYAQAVRLLDGVTGVNQRVAEIVLAEIGIDMSRFPSDGHLASWAGLCPGNKISAGKRLSGKTTKGSRWLRQALIEAAHGAAHTKNTFLGEQYQRLVSRIGKKKAIVALAHSILVIIYHVLKEKQSYRELGTRYFEERQQEATKRRAIRHLEQLGYQVTLQQTDQAA